METNTPSAEKGIVTELNFCAKTSKRITWEDWMFTIVGPLQIEVCNESYGYLKDEHTYRVTDGERDGLVVLAECECPTDRYREEYGCKHKVTLATVGGPVVLDEACDFPTTDSDAASEAMTTAADKLATDGGTKTTTTTTDPECSRSKMGSNRPDECAFRPRLNDLPCWPWYGGGFETPN